MPAIVGPLVGFLLGLTLAWLGRKDEDPRLRSRRTRIVALFAALVFAPVAAYFLTFAGDWAFFYVIDSRAIPSALELCLVMLDAGSVLVGFMAGQSAAQKRQDRRLATLALPPALLTIALVFAFLPALRIEGTYHQVKGAFGTQPVVGGPLGYAIVWMNGLLIAGVALTLRALAGERRAPPPQTTKGPAIPARFLGRSARD